MTAGRTLFALLVATLLAGCHSHTEPVRVPGQIYTQTSPDPKLEAGLWMYNYAPGGEVTSVGHTGSMLPLLKGGEYVVLVKDFDGIREGYVVAYTTVGGSSPPVGSRIIHRIAGQNEKGEWLPKGDTPGLPLEDWNPVTRENYIGTLVAVFTQR